MSHPVKAGREYEQHSGSVGSVRSQEKGCVDEGGGGLLN